MKHDIRKLFIEDDGIQVQNLPSNHRNEFFAKLKSKQKPKKHFFAVKNVAAIVISALIGIGIYHIIPINNQNENNFTHLESIEKEYQNNINSEWNNFLRVTNDSLLIKRYEQKLKELESDYTNLSHDLKLNPKNLLIIEDLISNLQNRLQLLQDIQAHIQTLNNNDNYEITL
jgi:hypothetical protein